MKRKIYNSLILTLVAVCSGAQEIADYESFQALVASQNTSYIAQQYDIDIAIAQEQAAHVFRDPEIAFSYGNNQDWDIRMGQTFDAELSYSIPLGGERRAGIRNARAEVELTRAAVASYLRELRQEAAEAYAEAWLAMRIAEQLHEDYLNMHDIAWSDSLRLAAGDLDPATAMQSSLEAQLAYNQWQQAEADKAMALAELSLLIGGQPVSGLKEKQLVIRPLPTASLEHLQQQALDRRADIIEAMAARELTQTQLQLLRASLYPELTLTAGYTHAMRVRNEEAPAPPFDGFSIGFSLPISFSSANRGNMRAAQAKVKQAETNITALRQHICVQVQQAYHNYATRWHLLVGFENDILESAQQVLQQRTQSYRKGDCSLVELIAARSTFNELYRTWLENCADTFVAQAALATAIGE